MPSSKAYRRKYYLEHKEQAKAQHRKYYLAHREQLKEYYQKHKERMLAYNRVYYRKHLGYWNQKKLEADRRVKLEVMTHYGNGKCACVHCGYADMRALSIDHINYVGTETKKRTNRRIRGGKPLYYWLRMNKFPEGFQTLCMNCQFIKRVVKREYGNL